MEFAKVYERDLVSVNALDPELHMWETFWMQTYRGAIPSSISDTLTNEIIISKHSCCTVRTSDDTSDM